jgi:aspartyl-tRNA(Asn)/glutamyl-tRNA(Gln) amidotransferase subunit A
LADLVETDSIFSSLNAYTNDVFTVPASLAGLPAASVPVSVDCRDEGSIDADLAGIQIIGQYGDDELVLKVSEILEGKSF